MHIELIGYDGADGTGTARDCCDHHSADTHSFHHDATVQDRYCHDNTDNRSDHHDDAGRDRRRRSRPVVPRP